MECNEVRLDKGFEWVILISVIIAQWRQAWHLQYPSLSRLRTNSTQCALSLFCCSSPPPSPPFSSLSSLPSLTLLAAFLVDVDKSRTTSGRDEVVSIPRYSRFQSFPPFKWCNDRRGGDDSFPLFIMVELDEHAGQCLARMPYRRCSAATFWFIFSIAPIQVFNKGVSLSAAPYRTVCNAMVNRLL